MKSFLLISLSVIFSQVYGDSLRDSILQAVESPVVGQVCNCSASCNGVGDPHITGFGATTAQAIRIAPQIITYYESPVMDVIVTAKVEDQAHINDAANNAEIYVESGGVNTRIANVDDCVGSSTYDLVDTVYSESSGGVLPIIQELRIRVECAYRSSIQLRGRQFTLNLYMTKDNTNVGFNNFLEFEESAGNTSGYCFTLAKDPGNSVCKCDDHPTPRPTQNFQPCDCNATCKMLQDPYVFDFNNNKQNYYGDDMYHNVYQYDTFEILARFQARDTQEWVHQLSIDGQLIDTTMCWNNWENAPNNCATRTNNARYKFDTIVLQAPLSDITVSVDVHCICKKRIGTTNHTRLDTWVHVHDNTVAPSNTPGTNAFLASQVTNGGDGMCFPGYASGVLSTAETANSPVCNCPVE
jgi:hypothetical protein